MNMIHSHDFKRTDASNHLEVLGALHRYLTIFSDPENTAGFFPDFVDWVIREWGTRPYYKTERFGSQNELANFPIRSEFVLKDMQPSYRDFIHSLNGRHHFSPVAVNGTNCESLERELYEFFHESMRGEGIRFLEKAFPELDADEFWDRIFLEDFTVPREIELMDRLCLDFGFYGRAAEPYTCLPPEVHTLSPGLFAEWFFEDFKLIQTKGYSLSFPTPILH